MRLIEKAKSHLVRNNMTYRSHWVFAISHGFLCIEAGLMLIIHSFFPCFFEKSGSALVRVLKRSFDRHNEEIQIAKTQQERL